jgi:hypothetical protein
VVLILFASPAVASAQEATAMVSGQTVRASSGEPIAGVHVAVLGTEMETTSAEKGWYIMFDVPPGRHRVQASMPGFETLTKVVTVHTGGALLLEFELAEDPVPLDEVIITESDRRRQFGNSVASVDSKAFEVTAMAGINAVLRDLVAGVHGTAASGQVGTGASIRVRGPTSVTQRTEPGAPGNWPGGEYPRRDQSGGHCADSGAARGVGDGTVRHEFRLRGHTHLHQKR